MHIAAFNGHLDIVRFLINEDETLLNIEDSRGRTPKFVAVHACQKDVVQLIDPNDDVSMLHIAVQVNDLQEVKTLVEKNVGILNETLFNLTALCLAAVSGNLAVVEYLVDKHLEENVGLDHSGEDGFTPLYGAAMKGHLEVVKLLIRKGANFEAVNAKRSTLLHAASLSGDCKIVEYMIDEMGFNVNVCDGNNGTPLHTAALNEKFDVVKFLLVKGANINAVNKSGETPLDYSYNNQTIYHFLMENGAKGSLAHCFVRQHPQIK